MRTHAGLLHIRGVKCSISAFESSMRSVHGQIIEGVILATGANPVPEGYRHGLIVPIRLAFSDQNENDIRKMRTICRSLSKPKRKFVPCKSGLHDRGEIVPTSVPFNSQDTSVPRAPALEGRVPRREEEPGIE